MSALGTGSACAVLLCVVRSVQAVLLFPAATALS